MNRPPKKTLRRMEAAGTARFLTFSCYRRHRLFDNPRLRDRFAEHLATLSHRWQVRVLAWVVMPEHVHLILLLPDSLRMEPFLRSLKQTFSAEVLKVWRDRAAPVLPLLRDRKGREHFWQTGGGYDRNCVGGELLEKIRYCHQNPIARGLVGSSVDWRWSSARAYEGRADAVGPAIDFDSVPEATGPLT